MRLLIATLCFGVSFRLLAVDTAYTTPVGGFNSTAAANTDTRVSTTLARAAVWVGTVASTGSGTVSSSAPGWTASAFAPGSATYYARMLSGNLRGQYFVITGNTTDTLTVDSAGLNLASIAQGDSVEIAPFWTLGTFYPASQAGVAFIASTSSLSRQTEILFFDANATGINRASSGTYYFFNGAWRKTGSAVTTSFDSTIIYPDSYVIQRNKAATTSLTYLGRVQPGYVGTVIEASTSANDNFVAISFPVDITLDQTNLHLSGFATSTSPLSPTDQLLWFDPAETGTNRAASATFFYYNGAWRRRGQSVATDFGTTVLKAGSGFIIRKAANGTGSTWAVATGF